jgi:hypothetical protein
LIGSSIQIQIGSSAFNDHASDFTIPAALVTPRLPDDHPWKSSLSAPGLIASHGGTLPLHLVLSKENKAKAVKLTGTLLAKSLAGDAAFFEALAQRIRTAAGRAKTAAKKKAPLNPSAKLPTSDWMAFAVKPTRAGKAPAEIWKLCQSYHKKGLEPTRRDIRNTLTAKIIPCTNLKSTLKRMGLDRLQEGPRPRRKSSI